MPIFFPNQVLEKDLKRQLQREQDKNSSLTVKYKECREENDKLRIIVNEHLPSGQTWVSLKDSLENKQVRGAGAKS